MTVYLIFTSMTTTQTMTYFPISEESTFTNAKTELTPLQASNTVEWLVHSRSEENQYLRQDVSLLFINGSLAGILNKWKQNVATISQKKDVIIEPNALIDTVSFHHGEIHKDQTITSIQRMSQDQLFIFRNHIFKQAQTKVQRQKEQALREKVNKNLQFHWDKLIDHFNLVKSDYELFPFHEIVRFEKQITKEYSEKNSAKIIGQLWEGLYKNYLLPAVDVKSKDFMPLILLAKDRTQLLVLYEMNGEKHQLIQQINLD